MNITCIGFGVIFLMAGGAFFAGQVSYRTALYKREVRKNEQKRE